MRSTALADVFTDPVHVDFSEAGMPAADFPREAFVGFARQALEPWTARQHISPDQVVVLDEQDPDTAVRHSYVYAQHHLQVEADSELYLMRGSYDNHVVRTPDGWKIIRLTQHVSWLEGNQDALREAGRV